MSGFKKAMAISYIGYRTGHHMLRQGYKDVSRIVGIKVLDGIPKFTQNYIADGLTSLTRAERNKQWDFSKCINCGLCDALCTPIDNTRDLLSQGPSLAASSYSRAFPWYKHAEKYLSEWKACSGCGKCSNICPTGVPLKEIVAFMQRVIDKQKAGIMVAD